MALEHMESRDVVFVGHGHFSRSVITRWVELPLVEGSRFWMPAASIAMCGFEHGVRQLSALGLTDSVTCSRAEHRRSSLCGPNGTLIADGVRTRYRDVRAAQAALRSGAAPMVLGALPFDVDGPAALLAPRCRAAHRRAAGLADGPAAGGSHRRRPPATGGIPQPDRPGARSAHRTGKRAAQGGAGPRVAAGRRCPAGCPHHPAPAG